MPLPTQLALLRFSTAEDTEERRFRREQKNTFDLSVLLSSVVASLATSVVAGFAHGRCGGRHARTVSGAAAADSGGSQARARMGGCPQRVSTRRHLVRGRNARTPGIRVRCVR